MAEKGLDGPVEDVSSGLKVVRTGQRDCLKEAILPPVSTSACTAVEATRAIITRLPLLICEGFLWGSVECPFFQGLFLGGFSAHRQLSEEDLPNCLIASVFLCLQETASFMLSCLYREQDCF